MIPDAVTGRATSGSGPCSSTRPSVSPCARSTAASRTSTRPSAHILDSTGIDPDRGTLLDLVRHAPVHSPEIAVWCDGLADVARVGADVARVHLSIAAPDDPPRWVQATAVRVVLGEQAWLLTHLEDATRPAGSRNSGWCTWPPTTR